MLVKALEISLGISVLLLFVSISLLVMVISTGVKCIEKMK